MTAKAKQKKKAGPISALLLVLCLGVLVVSGVLLGRELWDFGEANRLNDQLKEKITSSVSGQPLSPADQYAALIQENPDFIGWVTIPDSRIDYAVVHGEDNSHYLSTDFYGNPHRLGTVFLDYRAAFSQERQSSHLVLYGHSAKDGSFFNDVRNYKKLDYYKEHPLIQFGNIYDGDTQWVIFAAYMIDARDSTENAFWFHDYVDFADETEYNEFIDGIDQRNYYRNDVEVAYGDQFLTLSTCDYDFDDARFVITARKLREGETISSFQTDSWGENAGRLMPERWYQ